MAYSVAVRQAKRAEAIALIAAQKDTARQAYDSLATVLGVLAGMPVDYAGVFNPQDPEDAAIIADFGAANVKVNSALAELRAVGIDALGTNAEV